MRVITIQNINVVGALLDTGKFTLDNYIPTTDILVRSYNFMMKHYRWKHNPIFMCPVGYKVSFDGANLNGAVLIEMEIPDRFCKIQDYYGWSDFIYYMECPGTFEQFKGCKTVEQFGVYILDLYKGEQLSNRNIVYQVTTQFLCKQWIKAVKPVTKEFLDLYYYTDGSNILKSLI